VNKLRVFRSLLSFEFLVNFSDVIAIDKCACMNMAFEAGSSLGKSCESTECRLFEGSKEGVLLGCSYKD
jgi:hypothetical protein